MWSLGLQTIVALSILGGICTEPAELLQIRMPLRQLCGCEAHGGAGQLVFLMNMKRHVPYISADRVVWLCLSCWLTLSTGKLGWVLPAKISSGLQI